MKEAIVPADTAETPGGMQETRGGTGPGQARPQPPPVTAVLLLGRLERLVDSELGPLRAGVEPLLEQVRQDLGALYPGPEGTLPPPKEQQALRERLGQALDELEDVLEALQMAASPRGER